MLSHPIESISYWDLTDARILFGPKEEKSTIEGIVKQITILNSIQDSHLGYLNIMTDAPEDRGKNHRKPTNEAVVKMSTCCLSPEHGT